MENTVKSRFNSDKTLELFPCLRFWRKKKTRSKEKGFEGGAGKPVLWHRPLKTWVCWEEGRNSKSAEFCKNIFWISSVFQVTSYLENHLNSTEATFKQLHPAEAEVKQAHSSMPTAASFIWYILTPAITAVCLLLDSTFFPPLDGKPWAAVQAVTLRS